MHKKQLIVIFLTGLLYVFIGCKDNAIDISDGNNNTSELHAMLETIDVQNYKDLEDVISNNITIDSQSLPIMLIFGNNNCSYCEKLKQSIHNDKTLRQFIKDNFVTYYINESYSKNHDVRYLQQNLTTSLLSKHYNLSGTPLTVWVTPEGKELLRLAGYNMEYFKAMLHFIHNKDYGKEEDSAKIMQIFIEQYKQNKMAK